MIKKIKLNVLFAIGYAIYGKGRSVAGSIIGKSDAVERLLGSLVVDSSKIRRELGWMPPYTMEEGLEETAEWFKRRL